MKNIDKGRISNTCAAIVLVVGLTGRNEGIVISEWLLAAGLFGFAGGVTNWLAVKMLFDRVPLLYGSGVILDRFREIRSAIRNAIMHYFFDEEHIKRFFEDNVEGALSEKHLIDKIRDLLQSPRIQQVVDNQISELMNGPQGMMLKMVGPKVIKPIVMQFIIGVGEQSAPLLVEEFRGPVVEPDLLREKLDESLDAKLEELTPEHVKEMMEDVIREHLGWLIVWGNVFGALIGILAKALGF